MAPNFSNLIEQLFGEDSVCPDTMQVFAQSNAAYTNGIDIKDNFYYALMCFLYNKLIQENKVELIEIKPLNIDKIKTQSVFGIKLKCDKVELKIPFFSIDGFSVIDISQALFVAMENYHFQGDDGCFACIHGANHGCDYCTIAKAMDLVPDDYKFANNVEAFESLIGHDMYEKIVTFIKYVQTFSINNTYEPIHQNDVKNLQEFDENTVTSTFVNNISKLNVDAIELIKDLCTQVTMQWENNPNDAIFKKIHNKLHIIPSLGFITATLSRLSDLISKINSEDRIEYHNAFECAVLRYLHDSDTPWKND